MNQTLKLLKIIGSPFCDNEYFYSPENKAEGFELYNLASKNKIGLLYLKSLKDRKILDNIGLEREYELEIKKHYEQINTVIRISKLFNDSNIKYAVFKSIMPFPATPNDVDIIHFGSDKEYNIAVESMLSSEYMEVKGEVDAEQRMFHDIKYGGRPNPHSAKKDVYDVDLYQKISASKTIYLNKAKLEKYIVNAIVSDHTFKALESGAELVAIIIHSIIPEMIFTLFVYYSTLYYLRTMSSKDIEKFIDIAKDNNVTYSVKLHLALVAELHESANGFVPKNFGRIYEMLGGKDISGRANLANNDYLMPHKYSISSVVKILLEKSQEEEFRKSTLRQMRYMLNPRSAKWVVGEIIQRRRRDTY